jgi:hypothetical protein
MNMKKIDKLLIALAGVLVTLAPFITIEGTACGFISNELDIPRHLLE